MKVVTLNNILVTVVPSDDRGKTDCSKCCFEKIKPFYCPLKGSEKAVGIKPCYAGDMHYYKEAS